MAETCDKCRSALDEDEGYVKEYTDERGLPYTPPRITCMDCYLKSKMRKVTFKDPQLGG